MDRASNVPLMFASLIVCLRSRDRTDEMWVIKSVKLDQRTGANRKVVQINRYNSTHDRTAEINNYSQSREIAFCRSAYSSSSGLDHSLDLSLRGIYSGAKNRSSLKRRNCRIEARFNCSLNDATIGARSRAKSRGSLPPRQ